MEAVVTIMTPSRSEEDRIRFYARFTRCEFNDLSDITALVPKAVEMMRGQLPEWPIKESLKILIDIAPFDESKTQVRSSVMFDTLARLGMEGGAAHLTDE